MKYPIRRLVLEFPHGESVDFCSMVAHKVSISGRSGNSEGGMTMTYMPMTQEEEKHRGCEFKDDEMTYIYGYLKEDKK
jgi:hypothetical protein